jgi:hypothetical protein
MVRRRIRWACTLHHTLPGAAGSIAGTPVTDDDPGLRPSDTEEIPIDASPFRWEGNSPHGGPNPETATFHHEGSEKPSRAEWMDGPPGGPRTALVHWGDNLTWHGWDTHSPIRIEIVLWDQDDVLRGFHTLFPDGGMRDEIFGTDGSVVDPAPTMGPPN